jgi:hypothetical protein
LAPVAFLMLAGYLGLQAVLRNAPSISARTMRAPSDRCCLPCAAPQPLSPFHWLIIVQHGDTYHETR